MSVYATDNPYQEWMKHLPIALTKIPLNYIAIPGSHDSFTYSITKHCNTSPDAEDVVKKLTQILGFIAKTVIARWAKAQELNTFGQLQAGIRYFDIRSAKNVKAKGEIYSCHSLFGGRIKDELIQINDFLNIYPNEVVFLDFNHFYQFGMEEHNRLVRNIEQIFGSKLVNHQRIIPSLETLWKSKRRVFVFYHSYEVNRPFLWPGYFIPSPWPNVNELSKLIEYWNTSYKRGHDTSIFFVTQGVLTPRTSDIVKNIFSSLKSHFADEATPAMANWMADKFAGKNRLNISIADFAGDYNYISSVMEVNAKTATDLTENLRDRITMKGDEECEKNI